MSEPIQEQEKSTPETEKANGSPKPTSPNADLKLDFASFWDIVQPRKAAIMWRFPNAMTTL
jgi:hypothetical protein